MTLSRTNQDLLKHKQLTDILVDRLMKEYVLTIDQALEIIREYLDDNKGILAEYNEKHKVVLLDK